MDRTARHVFVSGHVQGVAFRWYAHHKAQDFGVDGWCRNLPDGRVEVTIEGEKPNLDEMVRWLRNGPPGARVEKVEVSECPPEGFSAFEIR